MKVYRRRTHKENNMTNIKKFFAGLALAAGIVFAPATVFAADEDFVEETADVQEANDIVISIPVTTESAPEQTPDTQEVEEVAPATDETPEQVEAPVSETSNDEVAPAAENEEIVDNVSESSTEEVANDTTEQTSNDERVAGDVITEDNADDNLIDQTSDEEVQPIQAAAPAMMQAPATGEEVAATNTVADEVTADAATEETTNEVVTGEQVGDANRGYAHMSDDSDAFCIEVEKDHIEESVQYIREDNVDGSQFNNIFVARQNELDNTESVLSAQDVNSITQLAIWATLSNDSYTDLVDFYYHESGITLYERMFAQYEGDWTFKYWSYTPNKAQFQKLISGMAQKVVIPEEVEIPEEPETPEEPVNSGNPEEPVVPEQPDITDVPNEPVVPETPVTTDVPEQSSEPEQPRQSEQPSQPSVEVLSETMVAPTTPAVPVLSARMASTGDATNAHMFVLIMAVAVLCLLVRKERN